MSPSEIIVESWQANADNWIATVDNNELESRRLVTNEAIVNAVLLRAPTKLLDLGCGEGWLSRRLRKEGIEAWGTDAVQALVNDAIKKDGRFYFMLSYIDIARGLHRLPVPFSTIVINFALLDEEDAEQLLLSLPALLAPGGHLIIQTLHSLIVASSGPYASGWKEGSWSGMSRSFVKPYQWYFRTLEDWMKLFLRSGFMLLDVKEPIHPQTGQPLSFIFTLQSLQRP